MEVASPPWIYFTMSQETKGPSVTAEELLDQPENQTVWNKVSSSTHFEEWCRQAPSDKVYVWLKVCRMLHNMKEIGIPAGSEVQWKPFLIKRPGQTGFLYSHRVVHNGIWYFIHPFHIWQTGYCFMKSYFKEILATLALWSKGRTGRRELPGMFGGLMQLCTPNPRHQMMLFLRWLSIILKYLNRKISGWVVWWRSQCRVDDSLHGSCVQRKVSLLFTKRLYIHLSALLVLGSLSYTSCDSESFQPSGLWHGQSEHGSSTMLELAK
jgi:hypothetical protein